MTDEQNPRYALQVIHADILASAARGELDLNALARRELASRGLDQNGQWVGFREAERLHGLT